MSFVFHNLQNLSSVPQKKNTTELAQFSVFTKTKQEKFSIVAHRVALGIWEDQSNTAVRWSVVLS